ncbi:MAG: [citrate (pro-3S)-lyase] ligase [Clostridia bacterium]|nr:[citrate (pro-3S)-lyase] ligase [Clostridia bacterium]
MLEMGTGAPLKGARLNRVREFLAVRGLRMGDDAEYTVCLFDEREELVGTGSLSANVLKYIAVAEDVQGEGACAKIVSELVSFAYRQGRAHLFVFTKPQNEKQFRALGFYPIVSTEEAMLLENDRRGLSTFLNSLPRGNGGVVGAAVVNCNPFTLGHAYLLETAAGMVDWLHVFVLSENRSHFDAQERYLLVREGTKRLKNVFVHRSADYLISSATFPTYFMKESADSAAINADLDILLFAERIAPALNITKRFVGTEPFCAVTRAYNERMKAVLPKYGIELVEIERKDGISASEVRRLMAAGDMEGVRRLVPECTYEYLYGGR